MLSVNQIASAPLGALGYQAEVAYGQPPTTAELKYVRRRSTTLGLSIDTYASEELTPDRQTPDLAHATQRPAGNIIGELAPGSYTDFIEALMGGVWTAPPAAITMSGTNLTAAAVGAGYTGTLTRGSGSFADDGFLVGARVSFTSTTGIYNNKKFTIIALTDLVLTLSQEPGFTHGASVMSTGSFSQLGNRVDVNVYYRSFLLERAFTDISRFQDFYGCRFNTAQIRLPSSGIATVEFGVIGREASALLTASFDGTTSVAVAGTTLGAVTFDSPTRTAVVATGSWVTAGFAVGDKVVFSGLATTAVLQNNNKLLTILNISQTSIANDTITVAETVADGANVGTAYTATRQGVTVWGAASTNPVLVASSGSILVDGQAIAVVTDATLNIDNRMESETVVGSNLNTPTTWGLTQPVTGSLTFLLEAETEMYTRFKNGTEFQVTLRLENSDGSKFMSFFMPRCKLQRADIGDAAASGIPVTTEFMALKPVAVDGINASQLTIFEAA